MTLVLSGSNGLSDVDGSAATPAIRGTDANTGMFFPAADTIAFSEGGAEIIRITSTGRVGIGLTSPAATFSVLGTSSLETARLENNNSDAYLVINQTQTGTSTRAALSMRKAGNVVFNISNDGEATGGATYYEAFNANGQHIFYSNGTERARIDTSGNLLVGTTSNNGVVTSFTSSTTGRAGFFMVNAASSLAADALGVSKFDNNTTTSQVFVKFFINNNAAASGLITANGANQAAFTSSSDARLKENIALLPSQLEKICALKPSEFDYKDGTGHQIGFIAQEMQEVYPDCVGEDANGMLLVSGWSKTEACLVSAIQELKVQNDDLKARVAVLEGK